MHISVRCRQKEKEGAKGGWFAKFPNDIIKSEKITGGDVHILEKDPYVERTEPKISYKDIFGTPDLGKKTKGGKKGKDEETPKSAKGKNLKRKSTSSAGSPATASPKSRKKSTDSASSRTTPSRPIVHPRFREGGGGSDHQVKILLQPSAPQHLDLLVKQEKVAAPNAYTCQLCDFTATRLNVIVLHH